MMKWHQHAAIVDPADTGDPETADAIRRLGAYADGVVVAVTVRLGWRDRLRLLWHGFFCVDVQIELAVDGVLRRAESKATSWIPAWSPRRLPISKATSEKST